MSVETEGQSPEERARQYMAKADLARLMVSKTSNPMVQESLKRLAADWEYLAASVLEKRI